MIFVKNVKSFGEIAIETINSDYYRKEMIGYGRTGSNSYSRNCDYWKKDSNVKKKKKSII